MSYLSEIAQGGFDADAEASDTQFLTLAAQGLYIGVTGDVKVITADNSVLTFEGVAAGSVLPFHIVQVFSTGTTATGLIGCRK